MQFIAAVSFPTKNSVRFSHRRRSLLAGGGGQLFQSEFDAAHAGRIDHQFVHIEFGAVAVSRHIDVLVSGSLQFGQIRGAAVHVLRNSDFHVHGLHWRRAGRPVGLSKHQTQHFPRPVSAQYRRTIWATSTSHFAHILHFAPLQIYEKQKGQSGGSHIGCHSIGHDRLRNDVLHQRLPSAGQRPHRVSGPVVVQRQRIQCHGRLVVSDARGIGESVVPRSARLAPLHYADRVCAVLLLSVAVHLRAERIAGHIHSDAVARCRLGSLVFDDADARIPVLGKH